MTNSVKFIKLELLFVVAKSTKSRAQKIPACRQAGKKRENF